MTDFNKTFMDENNSLFLSTERKRNKLHVLYNRIYSVQTCTVLYIRVQTCAILMYTFLHSNEQVTSCQGQGRL